MKKFYITLYIDKCFTNKFKLQTFLLLCIYESNQNTFGVVWLAPSNDYTKLSPC